MSKTKKILFWCLFVSLYPTIFLAVAYHSSIIQPTLFESNYIAFLLTGIAIACFPMKVGGRNLFLINGVSMATFFTYGLFPEMLLTQLTLLISMFRGNIGLDQKYRYTFNMVSYQIMSIASAVMYHMITPHLPDFSFYGVNIIGAYLYLLVFLSINQLSLSFNLKVWFNQTFTPFKESFWISIWLSFYTIPSVIVMVYFYDIFEAIGIILVGISQVTVCLSFHYYFESKLSNEYLARANTLAQQLSGHGNRQTLLDTYLENLPEVFEIDTIVVYDVEDTDHFGFKKIRKHERSQKGVDHIDERFDTTGQTIIENTVKDNQILVYDRAADWLTEMDHDIDYPAESVLSLPIKRSNKVVGVLLITNKQKNAFRTAILDVAQVLNNYFNIAMENARHLEMFQEKSEKDHLTNLPNLRGLETLLKYYYKNEKERVSAMIVIDLDHFKRVNDQYGHEAGNELLIQLADLLQTFVDIEGEVARYGGEEFVVFLPGYITEYAEQFAELLRDLLDQHAFTITNYLSAEKETIQIKVTGSFGVASYPDQVLRPEELISAADHAMYIGAKRKGRNRVSVYEGSPSEWAVDS